MIRSSQNSSQRLAFQFGIPVMAPATLVVSSVCSASDEECKCHRALNMRRICSRLSNGGCRCFKAKFVSLPRGVCAPNRRYCSPTRVRSYPLYGYTQVVKQEQGLVQTTKRHHSRAFAQKKPGGDGMAKCASGTNLAQYHQGFDEGPVRRVHRDYRGK